MEALERYFSAIAADSSERRAANLRFYLDFLFSGVSLRGSRVLDIGAGAGLYGFYAASVGAQQVVALEPEADGSRPGVRREFERLRERLGLDSVELRAGTVQDFDPDGECFDVVLMHSVVNHLDEQATMTLHRNEAARQTYRRLFQRLAAMTPSGGKLIVVDASRANLFSRLPVRSPVEPGIEWEKHQSPRTWARLLQDAGFAEPRVRWRSPSTLRRPGRLLLGNRVAAWFLDSVFCLTMTRRGRG